MWLVFRFKLVRQFYVMNMTQSLKHDVKMLNKKNVCSYLWSAVQMHAQMHTKKCKEEPTKYEIYLAYTACNKKAGKFFSANFSQLESLHI